MPEIFEHFEFKAVMMLLLPCIIAQRLRPAVLAQPLALLPDPKFKDDNFCLLMLLRGMCLKGMKSPLQAQECFEKVMEYNGKLKGDKHLIPYTMYEFSLLVRDEGRLEAALAMMEKAK